MCCLPTIKSRDDSNILICQIFTMHDLAIFNGTDNPQGLIFISLCGVVYDVSSAKHFYGVGKSYNVYAGRESARALGTDSLVIIPSFVSHSDFTV